jgi:hypothetical protein
MKLNRECDQDQIEGKESTDYREILRQNDAAEAAGAKCGALVSAVCRRQMETTDASYEETLLALKEESPDYFVEAESEMEPEPDYDDVATLKKSDMDVTRLTPEQYARIRRSRPDLLGLR